MKPTRGLGKGLSALFSETEEDYGKSLLFDEEPKTKGEGVTETQKHTGSTPRGRGRKTRAFEMVLAPFPKITSDILSRLWGNTDYAKNNTK